MTQVIATITHSEMLLPPQHCPASAAFPAHLPLAPRGLTGLGGRMSTAAMFSQEKGNNWCGSLSPPHGAFVDEMPAQLKAHTGSIRNNRGDPTSKQTLCNGNPSSNTAGPRRVTSTNTEANDLFTELLKRPDVHHNKPRQEHHGPTPPARSWQQGQATTLPT